LKTGFPFAPYHFNQAVPVHYINERPLIYYIKFKVVK
jgi:hypothetical protein